MTLALMLVASPSQGDTLDESCRAVDVHDGIEIVAQTCPIGEGLWGREPSQDGWFWIQCGMLDAMPEAAFRKAVEEHTPFLLRPEAGQYRCLTGPYQSYAEALKIRDDFRQSDLMADVFICEVGGALAASPTEKATTSERVMEPVEGLWTPLPKGKDNRTEFGGQEWWSATYQEAREACQNGGKKLASMAAIQRAVSNGSNAIPTAMPYWLDSGSVYDTQLDMSFVAVSDNLMLHVLCE